MLNQVCDTCAFTLITEYKLRTMEFQGYSPKKRASIKRSSPLPPVGSQGGKSQISPSIDEYVAKSPAKTWLIQECTPSQILRRQLQLLGNTAHPPVLHHRVLCQRLRLRHHLRRHGRQQVLVRHAIHIDGEHPAVRNGVEGPRQRE